MRKDELVYRQIMQDRQDEKETACCVRNDQSKLVVVISFDPYCFVETFLAYKMVKLIKKTFNHWLVS